MEGSLTAIKSSLDTMAVVKPVNDIRVEIIGSQPLQSPVDLPVDCPRGQSSGIEIDLGGNDYVSGARVGNTHTGVQRQWIGETGILSAARNLREALLLLA